MSRRLDWRKAVRASDVASTAKLVAFVLDTYMDVRGFAWPARNTIARGAGVKVDSVDRALRELEDAGLLVVVRSRGRVSNRYQATFPNSPSDAAVGDAEEKPQQPHPRGPNSPSGAAPTVPEVRPEAAIEAAIEAERRTRADARALSATPIDVAPKANPQQLVALYVDLVSAIRARPPRRLIGQVAREIGQLADEGYTAAEIEKALALMVEKRLNPSTLASLMVEAQAGPAKPRRPVHVVDQFARQVIENRSRQQ